MLLVRGWFVENDVVDLVFPMIGQTMNIELPSYNISYIHIHDGIRFDTKKNASYIATIHLDKDAGLPSEFRVLKYLDSRPIPVTGEVKKEVKKETVKTETKPTPNKTKAKAKGNAKK